MAFSLKECSLPLQKATTSTLEWPAVSFRGCSSAKNGATAVANAHWHNEANNNWQFIIDKNQEGNL